ncbi:MAG: hypothetical protein K0S83_411 [Thermomicrobiales bacterium]|jgi:hypothetical protein|nr:hypothetical protein [Thermomicrobiales bacterium]
MVKSEPIPFAVGDVVRLKKPHPCGGLDWNVVRLGADIGVKCQTCGRRVLLPRRDLERRIKLFVTRASEIDKSQDTVDPPPSGIVGGQAGS